MLSMISVGRVVIARLGAVEEGWLVEAEVDMLAGFLRGC